jgi:drug/metabolite transporter (DMT)-like permease
VLLAAAACWAGAGLIAPAAPLPGPTLAFWRCLLGASVYQAVLAGRGRRPRWEDVRTAALGGIGFGASIVCLFVAYKTTTIVSANVIGCLQPLVLGFVASRSTGRLGRVLWAATIAAAIGTAIVVIGSSEHSGTWSLRGDLFAVAGIGFNIVYVIGTKRARSRMETLDYQAALLWVAAVVALPAAIVTEGTLVGPTPWAGLYIAGIVAVGGSGHLLFSAAQRHVSVAASSSILLAEVVAVSIGAAIVFGQSISVVQALGMAVVAAAVGVWLARTPGEPAPIGDEPVPDQPPL